MFKGLLLLASSAVCLIALCSTASADGGSGVFTGTLGKMPIVLGLNTAQEDEVIGRYFYEKYHRDLGLSGSLQGKTLTMVEGGTRYDDGQSLPTLTLQKTANGWQGEWKSLKGKVLPVQLTEATLPAPGADLPPVIAELRKSDPYEYLRLLGLKLKPGKKESFMGHDLQWWTEPQSGISMFSVESGYSKDELQRVNRQLLGRLWTEVISYHGCLLQGADNAEFDQGVAPKFLSPDVISLNISTSYYCGGVHPDFGNSPLNLDAHTGHSLSLEDVLWVGTGKPPLYAGHNDAGDAPLTDGESQARYTYQREVFAPWLIKQFTTLYPDEMLKPTDEDSCDYTDEGVWGYSNWYFTEKGLYLGPFFVRAQRVCDDPGWSVLPYAVVKQHPGAVKLQLPGTGD
ncbi:hypothetical protein B0E42_27955 [Pseudomonas sp. A25(2017)]|uniref:DUF3298 domain-containing protein n=1 Tax=Pseudomonas sp. A25(2017) TaxID=1945865 RepID=UPI0009848BC6|nr:DUF3298 domain-containing protein [Pseudomonas sp. A25(2017)]OOG80323.1 hypothetical protein B0E42_27955 [Pseudomonas sp. A25(2017)]